MPSHKLKSMSSGRSVRNEVNNFLSTFSPSRTHYGTIFSSANMAHSLEESGLNDLAHMDKRSAHNALERQRRETLNTKFQQLAHALPTLQAERRPSKALIVTKSLEYVNSYIDLEKDFKKKIDYLRQENGRLRDEAKLRAKQHGRKSSARVTKPTATSTSTSSIPSSACSKPFAETLCLSPEQLMLKTEKKIKEELPVTAAITPSLLSLSQTSTPSAAAAAAAAGACTSAKAELASPASTTLVTKTKRSPSSISIGSTNASSSSSPSAVAVNTNVRRQKSADEPPAMSANIVSIKKRSRHSPASPATTINTADAMSNSNSNNSLLADYASSSSMPHLTSTPHTFAISDEKVYQQDMVTSFANHHHHHPNFSSSYYPSPFPASAMMDLGHTPLTSGPGHHYHHHYAAAAAVAAEATMGMDVQRQQQHHLVPPFPASMPASDDRAMMPPFQPAMLDMTSSSSSYSTAIPTPPPSSYMQNAAYHRVIYPPPYPQPDQSAMDYLW